MMKFVQSQTGHNFTKNFFYYLCNKACFYRNNLGIKTFLKNTHKMLQKLYRELVQRV